MAAQKGRDLLLKIDTTGTGSFLTVAGLRSHTISFNAETRKAVTAALATQNNAEGLVAIARTEANLELKTDIVRKLSAMAPKNKVAADYLMEIIK